MNNLPIIQKNGSLAKKDKFADYPAWSSWIDSVFNNNSSSIIIPNYNTGISLPKVNIRETEDAFYVEMAVPGMQKEDFKIDLNNKILSIASKANDNNQATSGKYYLKEFEYASFKRTFTIPEVIEEELIKAGYENGILSVMLPKKEEAKQKPPRNISIS